MPQWLTFVFPQSVITIGLSWGLEGHHLNQSNGAVHLYIILLSVHREPTAGS